MTIKSFRGKLADGAMQEINIRTNNGKIGYRIVKFQILPSNLNSSGEAAIKIFKTKQTAAVFDFNFEDMDLIAVAYFTVNASADANATSHEIMFDNEVFNQNIFITHKNNDNVPFNYYLELEQMKLGDNESTFATLQSLRSKYEARLPAGPS